jgi:hypothetical protein
MHYYQVTTRCLRAAASCNALITQSRSEKPMKVREQKLLYLLLLAVSSSGIAASPV